MVRFNNTTGNVRPTIETYKAVHAARMATIVYLKIDPWFNTWALKATNLNNEVEVLKLGDLGAIKALLVEKAEEHGLVIRECGERAVRPEAA